MRYSAVIEVFGDKELVRECFEAEARETKRQRSIYEVRKKQDSIEFVLEAADAVALRAALNSIGKMLQVLEKTK